MNEELQERIDSVKNDARERRDHLLKRKPQLQEALKKLDLEVNELNQVIGD